MSYKDLETAFSEYVEFAARNLKPQDRGSETLRVIRNPLIELNEIIERLEKSEEFQGVAQETQRVFPLGVWIVNGWEHELRNFFRRSGFYQERFSDKPFGLPALFELYMSSLKREKVRLRFIAPIATIDFGLPELELPEFAIRKFGMSELDNIFENGRRRIFYPTTVVDSTALADYWCIDTTMQMPRERGTDTWHEDLSPSFLKEISVFPGPVEQALKNLVLYDWQRLWLGEITLRQQLHEWEPGSGWCRFSIPSVLATSDDLLSWPGQSNAVPEIEIEYDDDQEEIWRDSLVMEQGEVQLFVSFTRSINDVLARVMAHSEWRFLDIALGFLVKAFFSEGLQQLLWHISVVESLLGEKKEGITDLLSRRVACILGKTRKERASVYKSFKKLYDFRSDLVHGNRELLKANKIYVGHLREAPSCRA